jgi:transcriptional regulator GlxA family with amidase domain
LRQAYHQGAHVVSTCTGAFILGQAGLLDGRECTTHWKRLAELRERFSRALVKDNCIFVADGRVITSGGVTCGIDMALYLVEKMAGPVMTQRVARELNVYIRRDGNHSQKSVYIDYRNHQHPGIHKVQDWLSEHPEENRPLSELAALGGLSARHFSREFRAATGLSAGEYRTLLRLEHARILLNDPHLSVEGVAAACGFRDGRQLRRLWRVRYGASPRQAAGEGAIPG